MTQRGLTARSWRAWILRRLLGRLHIGDDIIRHLSTFQRLGATLEVAPPLEMLPVGARTIFRAVRTRAAADVRPDWLWPYWLERQLDPSGPAFTPRGHLPVMQNVTCRNWTAVGNPGSPWEAIVDPRGLVTPTFDSWSLDWWVHTDGRWRFPSREEAVAQSLVGSAPVVRTVLETPTGQVIQQVYGVEVVPELVAVEVENASTEPVTVAFALRPYNPEGLAVLETIEIEGASVRIDRRETLFLPGPPQRAVLSTFRDGDVANLLDQAHPARKVNDPAGLAQAAFAFTVAPHERIRAALPLGGRTARTRWPMPWRRRMRHTVPDPARLPLASEVASDWKRRLERGLRVELPDPQVQQAVDANRAYLLLLHDPGSITPGPYTYHRFWFRDAAYQVAALDRWGFHEEAADVLCSYPSRQRPDGFFYSQWREWDANGTAIWTIAEHHRLTGDETLLQELAGCVARGADWIARTCADDTGKVPEARGLLPAGVSAEHLGPYDYYYWDNLWAWRGLLDAAAIAEQTGQPEAATRARHAAEALQDALFASLEQAARRLGRRLIPAGPTRGMDAGMIGSLVACSPLGLLDPDDEWITGTAQTVRERFCLHDAFYQSISHTGLGTYLTLQLAFVELEAGDQQAWQRFRWLLHAATPTFTWPEAVHPRIGGGCMGDGHHGWTAADVLSFVRMLLVRETSDGLALLSVLPHEWHGGRIAVRQAPTHHGLLSYEVTWDNDRPLLRWQLHGQTRVRLTAPGLDSTWSTTEPAGVTSNLRNSVPQ
ncbi:MAG: hypothetical protein ACRDYA_21190 [Egibacteraceae bacterium]